MSANAQTHHILPIRVYLAVGTALLVLTAVTVWVAGHDYGEYNLIVAMIIAAVKASLVAAYFMHLRYDNKVYLAVFVGALLFLAVFIILTMLDTLRRGDVNAIETGPIDQNAVIYQQQVIDTSHTGAMKSVDSASTHTSPAK
ncbi:MAG: cytochrome C oxidase subunit IV family protein [Candidatus Zixiibacteriota bacterium]